MLKELRTGGVLKGICLKFQVKKCWGVKKGIRERGLPFMRSNSANCPGNVKKREKGGPLDNTRKKDGEIL